MTLAVLLSLFLSAPEEPPLLTLPRDRRPAWLREEGIVMAGSWEPLIFRVRRDGSPGYEPTPDQLEAYRREHSEEMVRTLKSLGVNFVMIHAYKGFGLEAEAESLRDAKRFAELCRKEGLRVGCYASSGTIGWELFLKERPEAGEWVVRDPQGKPVPYGSMTFRHYMDRMHPGAVEYLHRVVRYAVEEIGVDLLHFDNYAVGPGYGPRSVQDFRRYLSGRYTPEEISRRLGAGGLESVLPPSPASPGDPLGRDYLRFECLWLAGSYWDLARYARSLRPEILMELNPGGVGGRLRPPVNHWLLLRGGEAFWDEGASPGWDGRTLASRIRTYKVGRRLGNMAFAYATGPLEAAEAIAFNLDCLGCIAWFEYGRLAAQPGSREPVSASLAPYVKLFRRLQPVWGGREVIADVASLRSFASQVFDGKSARTTWEAEEALIRGHVPFQIVSEEEPGRLRGFRVLLAAGCPALSKEEMGSILEFARGGRGLVLVDGAGTLDEDLRPRAGSPLESWLGRPLGGEGFRIEKEGARCAYLPSLPSDPAELIDLLRWAAGGRFSVEVRAPAWVACEFLRGEGKEIGIHLVNYAPRPAAGIEARISRPGGEASPSKAAWLRARSIAPESLPVESRRIEEGKDVLEMKVAIPDLEVHGFLTFE